MIETCIQELYEKLKDISDTPLLEAQWYFEEENPPSIEEFINRRKKKEPYGKIMGHVGFWKYDFKISKDVLSPRPDSEMLIEAVLQTYPDKKSSYTLLDIGTGSGCLLSTLLHEYPLWQGTGIDICQKALSVAKENLALQKATLLQKDITQKNWTSCFNHFDIIISNPPYITTKDMNDLSEEVKNYDPFKALHGGDDGLVYYRSLAQTLSSLCHSNSSVFFEIGYDQFDTVPQIMEKHNFQLLNYWKDYGGIPRILHFKIK